uniref:DUF7869 domain-containing protein n=1 Tax=Clytia hemisphaerica TaxID=252671 RepID=A0A7M5V597_9CNID
MGQQKRKGAKQCSSEYHHAVLWIKRFADDCGDAPPDRDPDSRVIPACFTKRAVYKTYKEEIQLQDGVLPPVLYVQMDNCWRENKNQFLLAFFAFLVLKRIVKKVRLSYLLVGHT